MAGAYHVLVLLFVEVHGHKQVLLAHSILLTARQEIPDSINLQWVSKKYTSIVAFEICIAES